MAATTQRLSLGDVNFFGFEVPERLEKLFGQQKMAVHDFPSTGAGIRTIQTLGSFPFPEINWKGIFFDGQVASGDAFYRANQLNIYKTQGSPQTLIWGPFNYQVIVKEFEITGRLKQQLDYEIKVVPFIDKTGSSNTSPASSSSLQIAFDANTGVTTAATSSIAGLLAANLIGQAVSIANNISLTLALQGGNLGNQSAYTASQTAIANLQSDLAPVINGANYGAATAATILSSALFALSTALSAPITGTPLATITVSNPNLMALASQYYGNTDLWPLIAVANNLQDVFPIGTFTLVIPKATTPSQFIPTS